jgi:hypothetical protein
MTSLDTKLSGAASSVTLFMHVHDFFSFSLPPGRIMEHDTPSTVCVCVCVCVIRITYEKDS